MLTVMILSETLKLFEIDRSNKSRVPIVSRTVAISGDYWSKAKRDRE